jgi:CubicO group peptidase (beta-lactamase class C family)
VTVNRSTRCVCVVALAFIAACSSEDSSDNHGNGRPLRVDSGSQPDWQIDQPERHGFDVEKLEAFYEYAFRPHFYTQGIVIIKDGYLVSERYAEGTDHDSWATSWSIGKSLTSALIGMSIDRGEITSVDAPMTTWITEWIGSDRQSIELRDVLAMSSGLDWTEDYGLSDQGSSGISDVIEMVLTGDPLRVAIDQPAAHEPGAVWSYSSGDTMVLGAALHRATGKTAAVLGRERIADPLHLSRFEWWQDGNGETYTFCCVDTTARDFAKFGQLYLQKGMWGGEQLISRAWVEQSIAPQAQSNSGYGYQWWLNHPDSTDGSWPALPTSTYFALGHNEQVIAIFPEQHLVIVRTGQYIKPDGDWIAESGLFQSGYASDNLAPTGTRPPEGDDWSEEEMLRLALVAQQD